MSTSEHKPASPARVTANRANATRSTGPKTQAGKAASSRNSVRHGYYAGPEPIGTGPFAENLDDLEALTHDIFEQLAPRDDLERGVAEQLVRYYVQARRLGVFEDSMLTAVGTKGTDASSDRAKLRRRVSVGQEMLGWLDEHGDPPGRDPRASAPADVPSRTLSAGGEFYQITRWEAVSAFEPLDAIRERFLAQFSDVAAAKRWILEDRASVNRGMTALARKHNGAVADQSISVMDRCLQVDARLGRAIERAELRWMMLRQRPGGEGTQQELPVGETNPTAAPEHRKPTKLGGAE